MGCTTSVKKSVRFRGNERLIAELKEDSSGSGIRMSSVLDDEVGCAELGLNEERMLSMRNPWMHGWDYPTA